MWSTFLNILKIITLLEQGSFSVPGFYIGLIIKLQCHSQSMRSAPGHRGQGCALHRVLTEPLEEYSFSPQLPPRDATHPGIACGRFNSSSLARICSLFPGPQGTEF